MRVAIVHYWFLNSGGGERVIEVLADMFPQADIFALFAEPGSLPANLSTHRTQMSFLDNKLLRRYSRVVFPIYPLAIESFDLRSYDLIISSDSPPMKGVVDPARPDAHLLLPHSWPLSVGPSRVVQKEPALGGAAGFFNHDRLPAEMGFPGGAAGQQVRGKLQLCGRPDPELLSTGKYRNLPTRQHNCGVH